MVSLCVFALTFSVSAKSSVSPGNVPVFGIPEARRELAAEAEKIRLELAGLRDFSETRQIDAYGFHGDYLPALDSMPEDPRWTVELSLGKSARVEQVVLVPAIDPRQGQLRGYGFPRRFRVSMQFANGSSETVAEWMDEDCPDPAHVPLIINLPTPRHATIRIEVYRGAREGDREFFALGEVFGVVENELWLAEVVEASPEFESRPYWSKDYLTDQKTGLGMPRGSASGGQDDEAGRDFSVVFERPPEDSCLIEFDLGSDNRMGWLTLFPAMPPSGSIVPGYGFPGKIELVGVRKSGSSRRYKPIYPGWDAGNPGENAVRLALYAFDGRWLQLKVSDFAEHNGHKVFALGEASISMKEKVYPVKATRLKGFPDGAEQLVGFLSDRLVGGRPELQMMEWFEMIERQNWLKGRLSEIMLADTAMEGRWSHAKKRGMLSLATVILLGLAVWLIRRQVNLQRLRLRLAEEQHHTEIEQIKLRFFTLISHELRTPLTVIPAPIERAMKEVGAGKLRDYLGVALKNVHELQQLVEQILDLRRIQDGKMRITLVEIELVEHLRSIIDSMRPLAERKGIVLAFEPAEECMSVRMDPRALKRILGNLIGNAIKFAPSDGRVEVGLSVVRHAMMLSVEDNGPGIGTDDLSHIFDQHYRGHSPSATQTHGSGIGLALVNEVVGLLGGRVQVESPITDGRGSRFRVELPLG